MKVYKVKVCELTAYAAICHELTLEKNSNPDFTISSRNQFDKVIRDYVRIYGQSSQDDHPGECDCLEEVDQIMEKYW